jgi:hypothetical protein
MGNEIEFVLVEICEHLKRIADALEPKKDTVSVSDRVREEVREKPSEKQESHSETLTTQVKSTQYTEKQVTECLKQIDMSVGTDKVREILKLVSCKRVRDIKESDYLTVVMECRKALEPTGSFLTVDIPFG